MSKQAARLSMSRKWIQCEHTANGLTFSFANGFASKWVMGLNQRDLYSQNEQKQRDLTTNGWGWIILVNWQKPSKNDKNVMFFDAAGFLRGEREALFGTEGLTLRCLFVQWENWIQKRWECHVRASLTGNGAKMEIIHAFYWTRALVINLTYYIS